MQITNTKTGSQVAVGDILGAEKCWLGQSAYPEPLGMVFNNVLEVIDVTTLSNNVIKCSTRLVYGPCDCHDEPDEHTLYLDRRWHVFETIQIDFVENHQESVVG